MDFVKTQNITKNYSAHKALDEVSLSIPKKSIFGLLGPNGAGKTTLIRIITKIIEPDNGEIFLGNEPMTPEMVRKIGYLPEERGLYKKMKVGDQLVYLGQLKGLSRSDAVKRIKQWLDRLDLSPWWNKNIEDLSKGMAQKVQFIATVLHDPKLIILDEPFSGFDPVNADLIKNEILELREKGATVIFSTHRMESVEELCDHIALINKSRKILDGPKKDIKEEHRKGLYTIEYQGTISSNGEIENLNTDQMDGGVNRATIRDIQGQGPNALLKKLIKEVEIQGFYEKIPSMNEIFISLVKDK